MKRLILFCILIVICGCSVVSSSSLDEWLIVPKSEQKWYAKEELAEVFLVNMDKFETVAKIILQNNTLEQRLQNSKEGQFSVEYNSHKDCFAGDEWDSIVTLMRKTGIFRINKNQKGGKPTVRFYCIQNKQLQSSMLCYCESNDLENLYYQRGYCSEFDKIAEHWWVGYTDGNWDVGDWDKYSEKAFSRVLDAVFDNDALIRECCDILWSMKTDDVKFIYVNRNIIRAEYFDGKSVQTENENETLQELFQKMDKLSGISVDNDRYIDFGGWGGLGIVSNIGFCYCPDDDLTVYDVGGLDHGDTVTEYHGGVFFREQADGDNTVYFRKIVPGYYYYELTW